MEPLNKFLKHHPCLNHADEFDVICHPLNQLGINYFSHVRVFDSKEFACLAQDSRFLRYYLDNAYFNFDAHRITPSNKEQYMLWDVVEKTDTTLAMHQDFNAHGYGHTFTIMQRGDDFTDFYNFATYFGNDQINNSYFKNLQQLKAFVAYFRDKVHANASLKKAYALTLPYCHEQGSYQTLNISSGDNTNLSELFKVDKIHIPGTKYYLSRREYDCLHWIAQGKTQNQIAQILAITTRTVKAHINNIKNKLNCYNLFQLGMHYAALKDSIHYIP